MLDLQLQVFNASEIRPPAAASRASADARSSVKRAITIATVHSIPGLQQQFTGALIS